MEVNNFLEGPGFLGPQVMIETLLDVPWEDLMRRHSIGCFRLWTFDSFLERKSWSVSTVLLKYVEANTDYVSGLFWLTDRMLADVHAVLDMILGKILGW